MEAENIAEEVCGAKMQKTAKSGKFASGHPDALVLMNDIMCKASNECLFLEYSQNRPLFAAVGWRSLRTEVDALKPIIMEAVPRHPRLVRSQIWENIMQEHFMRFLQSEFRVVSQFYERGCQDKHCSVGGPPE